MVHQPISSYCLDGTESDGKAADWSRVTASVEILVSFYFVVVADFSCTVDTQSLFSVKSISAVAHAAL